MTIVRSHQRTTAGRRRRGLLSLSLLLLVAVASLTQARAQTIQNRDVNQTQVQLGFIGMVTNSVLITIVGFGTTTISAMASAAMPTHATATVDFGTFSTLLKPPPANGAGYRVALPAPGAVVVASLDAVIDYNGATSATLTVGRAAPAGTAPDVPLANLRIASPSLASWTTGDQGVQVPDFGQPGYDICTATGDTTCIATKSYVHDLAVFVPDAQATGPFSTVALYTGTMP
jgi:hypothetical protein